MFHVKNKKNVRIPIYLMAYNEDLCDMNPDRKYLHELKQMLLNYTILKLKCGKSN